MQRIEPEAQKKERLRRGPWCAIWPRDRVVLACEWAARGAPRSLASETQRRGDAAAKRPR